MVDVSDSADEPTDDTAESTGDATGAGVDQSTDLESLIEDNPEAVARFLDRLDLVNDLLDATAVATSAMDDEMVQSLSGTGTNLAMAADGMATEETVHLGETVGENADELAEGVEKVAELQRTGTLDDLLEMAELASLLRGAADDEMIMSLASTGTRVGELADTATDEDVARGLDDVLTALGEASSEEPDELGVLGLMKATRDPDVKAGLGVIIALARALGQQTRERPEA
ncbi:hypothetical protein HLRTI_000357 [Halorhabdus tiamatea SARL4B]|uniref:DUF1641 domain-containing protein n=1 Tax=Halorhabdus tiamatea SARL4B TaxID=1033806 RepID=F7PK71_9EURY|nr:hypothetical protein HLRTI_000357 [Halorhabdus tiamatea SARL4B]CCQ33446.1 conserved hypothetical protein (DUF1641) [Halorhabdus tiamatea SARL4B]